MKRTYSALLSNGERIQVQAATGPKAIIAAQALVPEGVEVKSVVTEIPVSEHVTEMLDRYPTVCGECGANVKHSTTKLVSRPKPYPAGTRVVFGMPTREEMRVCSTHPDDQITNWPKPLSQH